ncbi:transposase [Cylindrospermopsis raciborskii S07]|uniref:Transposase n=2 Tax=Cylindrospermopsis raciborskii TaxID=77022 RepID=A0A853MEY0_9CYAN|nr:RNA-guided endonuclease TnpB family protein [Cylindrospermopsis raciborskii]OBU75044.1 transposase [Cylindrospermopsis raciborskii CS-505]OBU77906.1 transposase [Cylindrospermopsis raciborskii CS-505]OBU77930.1 transposase [Cylindrospermopsis raciborskii CS-505]PNK04801.1 transposase [Cylindrospermopsis raciborskii S07]
MLLSFKTALIPNNKQETLFRKASGVARHAYNWGNAYIKEVLELREQDKSIKIPTAIDLHKKLVAEVKSQHDWYYEVNKNVPQKALADCRVAWDRCFKKTSKQPRFKKKGQRDSFYLESGTKAVPKIQNDGKRIKLPSIGWVKLAEPLPVTAVHNCVISRQANKWFIAIKYEIEKPTVAVDRPTVGVDIGIKELAVCSNGKVFSNPKAYGRMSKRIKRLQRSVSKKQKGSNNRKKAVSKLAKMHARIANIRKDAIHKLTNYLAKNHSEIKIEDLSVKSFLKNHKLAGAIADCGMYEFRRQLEYKTEKFSSKLMLVDRMFPSSQICSNCGQHRHKMPLKNRVYVCPECGHIEDRDLNAAKNIERWFEGIFIPSRSDLAVSSTVSACGVDKPLKNHLETTMNQEVNAEDDTWFWTAEETDALWFWSASSTIV